jgi:septal ring factor EnvC (AmiA/AmiB activator)
MRKCDTTRNYSVLESLIEEAQTMANRMEAALADVKDLRSLHAKITVLKEEAQELEKKKEDLEAKIKKLEKAAE